MSDITTCISDLYRRSETPKTTGTEYTSSAVPDSILALQDSDLRAKEYPDFSDQDISDFVHFVLRLCDAPADLRGFLRAEACIQHMIDVFLTDAASTNIIAEQVKAITVHWLQKLREHVPTVVAILSSRPLIESAPLMSFHIYSFVRSLLPNGTHPFYTAYAHRLHLAIRSLKRKNPSPSFYISAIRAARYFYLYIPDDILSLPSHPIAMPKSYIAAFLASLRNSVRSNDINELLVVYERLFEHVLKRKSIRKRKKSRSSRKKKRGSGGDDTEFPPGDIENVILATGSDEFIDFANDDFILTDANELVVQKKPSLSRSWMDCSNCNNHHFPWDTECLKLDEMHTIYSSCVQNWGNSELEDRIIIFLLLQMHYGFDTNTLFQLSSGDANAIPRIEELYGSLYIITNPPILRADETHSGCIKPSKFVYHLVPEKISHLIRLRLKPSGPFFVFSDVAGDNQQMSLPYVIQYLNKFVNRGNSFFVTLSRIQSSFGTLYANRYGLCPIHCCYVSGTVIHKLYQAQLHYIYCSAASLEKEYLAAFGRADSRIATAPHFAPERKQLHAAHPDNYSLFFEFDNTIAPDTLPAQGYGSTKVPLTNNLKALVDSIKQAMVNAIDIVTMHNIYVCYAYLCLEFASALRPRNEPDDYAVQYIPQRKSVIIRDKMSPQFREERVISLPDTADIILSKLHDNFTRLRTLIAANVNSHFLNEIQDDLFFFIDDHGNKLGFTLKIFHDVLRKANINYEFPDNSPRHFVKTYLHDNKISIDTSDTWSGHSRSGREALNAASSIIPGETLSRCINVVEAMLRELGFEDVPYLNLQE